MVIDYQQVIEMIAQIIKIATPIGVLLSLSEWAVGFFIKNALGRWIKHV